MCGLAVFVTLATACVSPHPPVKRITFSGVPVDEELRASALAIATNDFAKVQDILQCPASEREFSIQFKRLWRSKEGEMGGYTAGNLVHLNPALFTNNADRLASTLRHEMTHLLQHYAPGAPRFWREGICDYVAFKLSETADSCQCTGQFPHYTAGYQCAAAFLAHMANTHDSNIVARLHAVLIRGEYSDDWFQFKTGKDLATLWTEFQATSGFTTAARERNALDEALKQPGLSHEQQADLFHGFMMKQPGGAQIIEAADFLKALAIKGKLPGFEPGQLPSAVSLETPDFEQPPGYPRTQTIRFISPDNRDLFVYRVTKEFEGAICQLVDAHKVDNRNGKVVNRYRVPGAE
jgi:hypothetical protein